MTISPSIATAIQDWLSDNGTGSLRDGAAANSRIYRSGGSSAKADLAAYLVARAPATYAAAHKSMAEIAAAMPEFRPQSLLDVGAGAGSSSWAAIDLWPAIQAVTFLDNNPRFLDMAKAIAAKSGMAAFQDSNAIQGSIGEAPLPQSDFVVASYMLAELSVTSARQIALRMWAVTNQMLLLVEPGTPAGFERIAAARSALLRAGAQIVAPCTHANTCPLTEDDWCHFSVRLSRAREHMHAKSAAVPFEDEPFSYLAVSRQPVAWAVGRIVRPVRISKPGTAFSLCTHMGLQEVVVPKRDRNLFGRVRKLGWGDPFTEQKP